MTTTTSPIWPDVIPVSAYYCSGCETLSEEVAGPLYECGSCGTIFNRENSADGSSHRCPDCGKFGAKQADESCAECNEGEIEEVTAYPCPVCEDLVKGEDVESHAAGCQEPTEEEATEALELAASIMYDVDGVLHRIEGIPGGSPSCFGPARLVRRDKHTVYLVCTVHGGKETSHYSNQVRIHAEVGQDYLLNIASQHGDCKGPVHITGRSANWSYLDGRCNGCGVVFGGDSGKMLPAKWILKPMGVKSAEATP